MEGGSALTHEPRYFREEVHSLPGLPIHLAPSGLVILSFHLPLAGRLIDTLNL